MDQLAIFSGHTDSSPAISVNAVHNFFVHRGAEHHFHDIHRSFIGHPHTINELCFDIEALQQLANLRSTPVHDDGVHANQLHQDDIPRKTLVEFWVGHGIATKLDDEGFSGEALDVRQRFRQNSRKITRLALI